MINTVKKNWMMHEYDFLTVAEVSVKNAQKKMKWIWFENKRKVTVNEKWQWMKNNNEWKITVNKKWSECDLKIKERWKWMKNEVNMIWKWILLTLNILFFILFFFFKIFHHFAQNTSLFIQATNHSK